MGIRPHPPLNTIVQPGISRLIDHALLEQSILIAGVAARQLHNRITVQVGIISIIVHVPQVL
jgi:hypothetical protein